MKRLVLMIASVVTTGTILSAQSVEHGDSNAGLICISSEACYEQIFLDADEGLKSSWAISAPCIGVDYYTKDNMYLGISLGGSMGSVSYDFGKAGRTYSSIYDMRLPLRVGVAFADRNFKLETGPFVNFTLGGESSYYRGTEETTTRVSDMDVSRVALGWSISMKLFEIIKVGYSFMLTDSPYGEGGDAGFLTIGLSYSIPIGK